MAKTNFENSEVQHYIDYLGGIINRMASNSANCKNWLLAIIAGCMAMQPSTQAVTSKIWLAYPLVILFGVLDAYYLGCEKYYRKKMGDFVDKVRTDGDQYSESLYKFEERTVSDDFDAVLSGASSIATWLFYGAIIVFAFLINNGIIRLV